MNFKEWFLLENTVSQELKNGRLATPEVVKTLGAGLWKLLSKRPWYKNLAPQFQENVKFFWKWLTYWCVQEVRDAYTHGTDYIHNKDTTYQIPDFSPHQPLSKLDPYRSRLAWSMQWWTNQQYEAGAEDYVAAHATDPTLMRSRFNNPAYTLEHLKADSAAWHQKLIDNKRQAGPEGRLVLQLQDGWKWVSLDRGYCSDEGDAMGHCGNSNSRAGDNIYSLRDRRNVPHLTFIVNDGVLGESKGFGNNKPSATYHHAILALLLGKDQGQEIVGYIAGGGYAPANNFHLEDLSPQEQQKLLTAKPYITKYFAYLKHRYQDNPQELTTKINDLFNFPFEKIDWQDNVAILKNWADISDMLQWLKDETKSELDTPDFDDVGMDYYHFHIDTEEAVRYFEEEANSENQKLMEEIIKELKKRKQPDEDDIEDDDIEWAIEQEQDLGFALSDAAITGLRMGTEADAYKSVIKSLDKDSTSNGFTLTNHKGAWSLWIALDNLEKLADDDDTLPDQIKFEYDPPYNGYSGFDESAYNERLSDQLEEIKRNLSP